MSDANLNNLSSKLFTIRRTYPNSLFMCIHHEKHQLLLHINGFNWSWKNAEASVEALVITVH